MPPEADKGEIESYAKQSYETELKIVEAKHRAELNSLEAHHKDEIISLHKEQSSNMMEIAKLLASRSTTNERAGSLNPTKKNFNSMTSSQRLNDLDDNIKQDLELLKDYQDELRYTNDPRTKARYRREIVRQEESVTRYKHEYTKLEQELFSTSSTQMQEVDNQLQQMDAKLNILLSGQVAIYEDILNKLDAHQLALTQKLQDAVDTNQVTESQMLQMLAVLEERIPSLPPSQAAIAEIIKDPELNVKQKLKVTLPIVPMLVKYEGEFELGSGLNIKSAWEQLLAELRRS